MVANLLASLAEKLIDMVALCRSKFSGAQPLATKSAQADSLGVGVAQHNAQANLLAGCVINCQRWLWTELESWALRNFSSDERRYYVHKTRYDETPMKVVTETTKDTSAAFKMLPN